MTDCLFCRIIARQVPGRIVYEDDRVVAFEDIAPKAPIHLLVVPRLHLATLVEAGESHRDLLAHLLLVANALAKERGVAERGFRLVLNVNPDGGQAVYHLHFHFLAGQRMRWEAP